MEGGVKVEAATGVNEEAGTEDVPSSSSDRFVVFGVFCLFTTKTNRFFGKS